MPPGMGLLSCHAGGVYEHTSRLMGYEALCFALADEPALVADVKALIGDSTDGYGGVRGIGPSAGPDLVRRFGSLADLYDRIDEVEAAGVRNRLLAGREDAFRCLDLATLRRDAPLSPAFDPEAGRVDSLDLERASSWLTAMGLGDVIRALRL